MTDQKLESIHALDLYPSGSPVVLFLHGLGADSESWAPQLSAMGNAGLRPVAVDLPGFGQSPLPPEANWSFAWVSARLAALLDQLGQQQACVVGLSLGGVIAQQFALDYSQRVSKLVLCSTFARLRPKRWNELAYLIRRFAVANLAGVQSQAQSVAWRIFPAPEQAAFRQALVQKIQAADPRAYQSSMRALAFFNARRKLKNLNIPTLVIIGERDTTVGVEIQMDLVKNIPGAAYVLLPDAGHAANIDQPELFNQALLAFLRQE